MTRAEELAEKATSLLNEICLDSLEHPLAEQEEWMGQTSALFVQLRDVQAELVADAEALAEALEAARPYVYAAMQASDGEDAMDAQMVLAKVDPALARYLTGANQ